MYILAVQKIVPVSADILWPVMANVMHWPDWTPTVQKVEALGPPELASGAQFRLHQPKLRPAVWTVTGLQEGKEFTWISESPGVKTTATHRVEVLPDGQARLELSVEFSGPLAFLVHWLAGGLTQQYIQQEAESLEKHCSPPGSTQNHR